MKSSGLVWLAEMLLNYTGRKCVWLLYGNLCVAVFVCWGTALGKET